MTQQSNVYVECDICNGYHLKNYGGDCRNDAQRFTIEQIDALQDGLAATGSKAKIIVAIKEYRQ